jgi:hypothetical protein
VGRGDDLLTHRVGCYGFLGHMAISRGAPRASVQTCG